MAKKAPQAARKKVQAPERRPRARVPVDQTPSAGESIESAVPASHESAAASGGPTVVGVGASAGGLEAFSQLLAALPADIKLAFVFVQHLSPQHESALPTLLAARTRMPVVEAKEGQPILPRHVYVIAPNVQMGVDDGRLHLQPRPLDRSQFTPIDHFFQSLANWAQNRAIGVILSGTASDGAAGIREIKAAGGITIAQQPATAKYDGMPRAAIGTGMVDLVLSPTEIAEHLAQIHVHPYLRGAATAEDLAPQDRQLAEIFSVLRRVSGVDFGQYKPPTVRRRLLRRMALQRLTDVNVYIRYLRDHPQEATALYQDLLIHVTRFFREPDSFALLAKDAIPELLAGRPESEPLRVWVPGCATGEEAYSVAIILTEALGDQAADRRIQIFATDVSESAIEHARAGVYPPSISAHVSPDRLKRFFTRADGSYRVSKYLRDLCIFARHDLTRDPPFSRLDLIVCRNVLIYLDASLQKRLMSVFHYALRQRGFLMLGPAETAGHQHLFTVVDKRWRLYRKAAVDVALPTGLSSDAFAYPPSTTRHAREVPRADGRASQDEASRVLLQRYSPPGVVIDANLQIVQFRGQTGPFLEAASGDPNLSILKMAREGLLFPLRTAIQTARQRHRSVRKESVLIRRNGDWHAVDLEVLPLGPVSSGQMLVMFEEASPKVRNAKTKGTPKDARASEANKRVAGLTRELAASREYLQSIIQDLEAANEELQSANEEILSSNEELQSTNEELDTTKEELQSTNEELNTLNDELHSRNEELSRVNSDLVNLLATVDITILIVGDDMRIRRFTPAAERVLNLIPGDVGRPVGQINTNLVSEDIEALTRETIDTMTLREREVQDRQGRWYGLRIRPYKNVDNRIDGAVLTLTDIGAVKRFQQHTERSRDQLLAALDLMHDPVLVVDEGGQVRAVNPAFASLAGLSSEPKGKLLKDLGQGEWNTPAIRGLVQRARAVDASPIEERVDIDLPSGRRGLLLSARAIAFDEGNRWVVMVVAEETGDPMGRRGGG